MIDRSKFHNSCASRAAPACGLPNELVEVFMKHEAGSPRPSVFHSTSLPYPGGGDPGSLAHASSVPAFNVRTSIVVHVTCRSLQRLDDRFVHTPIMDDFANIV